MPSTVLVAERVVRDGSRELGICRHTAGSAAELAAEGVGLFIEDTPLSTQMRIIPRLVRNLRPWQCVIAVHSWEAEAELADNCREAGLRVRQVPYLQNKPMDFQPCDVVVTIPEKLYLLSPWVRKRQLCPKLICLLDPHGTTAATGEWNGRVSRRADNISDLRATTLAVGVTPLVMFVCGLPARAMNVMALTRCLGVEAFQFMRGQSLRLHGLESLDVEGDDIDETASHWLDPWVTKFCGSDASQTMILVGGTMNERENALRDLSSLRSYPEMDLTRFDLRGKDVHALSACVRREIQRLNKRVIMVHGADRLFRLRGVAESLRILSSAIAGVTVLACGPDEWVASESAWRENGILIAPGGGTLPVPMPT